MDRVVQIMKKNGYRFTAQKKDVLSALQQVPLTVSEIYSELRARNNVVDKATVYRILTHFVKLDIAREIHLGDREVRYELTDSKHHHHLVCESCGDIKDISLCEEVLFNEVKKSSSFKVKSHTLEFFGICNKCQ